MENSKIPVAQKDGEVIYMDLEDARKHVLGSFPCKKRRRRDLFFIPKESGKTASRMFEANEEWMDRFEGLAYTWPQVDFNSSSEADS